MPRSHKKDLLATALREFKDKRSFISTDGHDFLYGKDWKRRVKECFERDAYMCRWEIKATHVGHKSDAFICGAAAHHPHHRIHKGNGGSDDLTNLMAICIHHHRIAHPEKQTRFGKA